MAILDEIKNEILLNRTLDGNEKICLIAMLCSSNVSDISELAFLMGVTENTAQMTVRSLRIKGYLKDSEIEADEAEISALRKLMTREEREFGVYQKAVRTRAGRGASGRAATADEFDSDDTDDFRGGGAAERAFDRPADRVSDRAFDRAFDAAPEHARDDVSDYASEGNFAGSQGSPNTAGSPNASFKSRAAALYKKDSAVAKAAQKIREVKSPADYGAKDVLDNLEFHSLSSSVPSVQSRASAAASSIENESAPKREKDTKPTGRQTGKQSGRSAASDRHEAGSPSSAKSAASAVSSASAGLTASAASAGASGSRQRPESPEDRVMNLIEESVTRSEAAIILGFAGGDYEKVEATYKRVRGTQIKDKVDALVKLLQAD